MSEVIAGAVVVVAILLWLTVAIALATPTYNPDAETRRRMSIRPTLTFPGDDPLLLGPSFHEPTSEEITSEA